MAKTKAERLKAVHDQALREFDDIQAATRDERQQSVEDRRFYSIAGAQWEGKFGKQFENKPKLEVNKVHLSVIRIINEYRNNRITVDYTPKSGNNADQLADACDALHRADENDSVAEEAYDNAFEESVGGGFGAWRYVNEYEDESDPDNDYQRIRMEPIYDADMCVFFDHNAKRQDKSDARFAFVLSSMTPEAYQDEFGEEISGWNKDDYNVDFDWAVDDKVFVAEYYRVEQKKEQLVIFENIDKSEERYLEKELDDDLLMRLAATGAQEVRRKNVTQRKVRKYILSGEKVLEDCGYIAGPNIPIVPCYGKRWYVDGIERFMGHVRLAKDAQRIKNMQLSKLAILSAESAVEVPIITPEQIAGHEVHWGNHNIQDYPYLLLNPIEQNGEMTPVGPIGYTKVPQIPPAMAALLQITEDDISDILGNQQNGEELAGNISTNTAELIQNRLDMQTYIYMSNHAKARRRGGEIYLGMAKEIYVEEGRKLKTMGIGGEVDSIELMQPGLNEEGETIYKNDFSDANFDVGVDVGPSSSTKRQATIRALSNMMALSADPETQQVIGSMIMMNMEGEGIADARDYFRQKLIRMGVVKPTKREQAQMQAEQEAMANQPPDAQTQYLMAAAANEEAKAIKAQADIVKTQAEADKKRAETAEILVDIDSKEQEQAFELAEKLGPRINPPEFEE